MASSGLMTYSQFKSSRQNSMNGSSARERQAGADHPTEEGEFEQVEIKYFSGSPDPPNLFRVRLMISIL